MDLFVVLFFLLFTFFLSSGSLGENEGEVSGKVSVTHEASYSTQPLLLGITDAVGADMEVSPIGPLP
jgi:hypothetical protein